MHVSWGTQLFLLVSLLIKNEARNGSDGAVAVVIGGDSGNDGDRGTDAERGDGGGGSDCENGSESAKKGEDCGVVYITDGGLSHDGAIGGGDGGGRDGSGGSYGDMVIGDGDIDDILVIMEESLMTVVVVEEEMVLEVEVFELDVVEEFSCYLFKKVFFSCEKEERKNNT